MTTKQLPVGKIKTLIAIYAVSKAVAMHGRDVSAGQANEAASLAAGFISKHLYEASKEGLISKAKINGFHNTYKVTAKGKKWLTTYGKQLPSQEEMTAMSEEEANRNKSYGKKSTVVQSSARYSTGAESAINSIATLIDENERLHALLRSIVSQCEAVLGSKENEQ